MESKKSSNFIVQGSILAAAGILVRLIGMLYQIPLINIIGKEGNGYYTSAFSIYSIMLILSSYSMPVAVSKMVAARIEKKQYHNAIRILKTALFYATIVGGAAAAALWFGADFFAELLAMPYCALALRPLAPTIWIMAYLGVLRGYFQGQGNMVPTAISQIFEQIVNAVVSVLAAAALFDYGLKANLVYDTTEYSYAYGASGSTLGTGAGALVALLFLLFLFIAYRPVIRRQLRRDKSTRMESYGRISWILCLTVLPVVISSGIYNSTNVIDNYIFGNGMKALGRGGEIAADWGTWGQFHLLFNIPVAISNALSSSLIPSIAMAMAERNRRKVKEKVYMSIRFSMIIAIPAAVGLTVLAAPISNLLFPGSDNSTLIRLMVYGSVSVVFYSLSTVTNAVLQGISRMKTPIYHALISMVFHVIALIVMVYVLNFGVYSVVFANILFALFMCVLNNLAIRRFLRYRQEIKKTFFIPVVAAGIMGVAAYLTYFGVYKLLSSNLVGTLCSIAIAVMVYGTLLIKLGGINAKELRGMPGGTRLLSVAKKLRLL
ncbi:MAG: polysaccharide biosynthesis C-terminal domain-containing protein [Lachnospiraceae bacterium]